MKNSEIIANINGLNTIAETNMEFPVRVAYAITKNLRTLMGFYEAYEPERAKIMDNIEDKSEEEKEIAATKLKELLDIDNEDVVIHKISLADLESCGKLKLDVFDSFSFMLEE